ncbi:LpxI family protein, partial [Rhizobiaceae sp. 2RAB30]
CLTAYDHATLERATYGGLIPLLRANRITHIVMAGGVDRRPSWWRMRITPTFLSVAAKALYGLSRGDDGLLRTVVRAFESKGFKVVGAHEIVPDLLAPEGQLTRAGPTAADRRDLDAAWAAARAIGALDIGQGAIAIGGRVIALEGIEGTDGLLERTKALRGHGRLASAKRGVLVKCAKPGQELRADLPAVGPATIDGAHSAGLAGVGIEAGRSIILDHGAMIARADALGLFVVGLSREAR